MTLVALTNDEKGFSYLERTKGATGSTMRMSAHKQLERGRKVETAINMIFFVKRKYLKKHDNID